MCGDALPTQVVLRYTLSFCRLMPEEHALHASMGDRVQAWILGILACYPYTRCPDMDRWKSERRVHLLCTAGVCSTGFLVCISQLVKGVMWAFEQPQNLAGSNVHTNVRMTALRLSDGSLLIYAPIAPTRCAQAMHVRLFPCRLLSPFSNQQRMQVKSNHNFT